MSKEYIERESLLADIKQIYADTILSPVSADSLVATHKVIEHIERRPAADVVKVVRCKDCKHGRMNYLVGGLCLCEKTIYDAVKGEIPRNTLMTEDDFCSSGERKETE